MRKLALISVFVAMASSVPSLAANPIKSGPQAGEWIPGPFHPINVNGAYAGDPHCLVCEYGLDPVVAVFARERNEILKSLLQKLDTAIERNRGARLHGFAVILNEDFAKDDSRKKLIKDLGEWATDFKHLIVAVQDAAGLEKYNLSKEAEVTVLLYRKHKVLANFAFAKDGLQDKDADAILASVAKMATAK